MRRFTLLAIVLCLTLAACCRKQPASSTTSKSAANSKSPTVGPYVIGKPVRYRNLTLYPVLAKTEKNDNRFITLDEGLKAGTVEIFEVGAESNDPDPNTYTSRLRRATGNLAPSGNSASPVPQRPSNDDPFAPSSGQRKASRVVQLVETIRRTHRLWKPFLPVWMQAVATFAAPSANQIVAYSDIRAEPEQGASLGAGAGALLGHASENGTVNQLMVRNKSGKPLYLMPGEVIVGGYQDRTIGQETVIASGDKAVPIDVFCVEHGRWSGRSEQQSAELISALSADNAQLDKKTVGKLARETSKGKFVVSAGNLSKGSRLAALGGGGDHQGQQAQTNPGGQFFDAPTMRQFADQDDWQRGGYPGSLAAPDPFTGELDVQFRHGTHTLAPTRGGQPEQSRQPFPWDANSKLPPGLKFSNQDDFSSRVERGRATQQDEPGSFFDPPPQRAFHDQDDLPRGQALGLAGRRTFNGDLDAPTDSARQSPTSRSSFFDPPPRRQFSSQDDVWNRVERANTLSGNNAPSKAFTGNYADKKVVARLKPYIDSTRKKISGTERVVGVIVAINGRIETIDIFESTPLFRKLWPKLLKSYALDAAVTAKATPANAPCTAADARRFLRGAMRAKVVQNRKTPAGLRVTKRSTAGIVSFAATDVDAPNNRPAEFGESVHAAAFSQPQEKSTAVGN